VPLAEQILYLGTSWVYTKMEFARTAMQISELRQYWRNTIEFSELQQNWRNTIEYAEFDQPISSRYGTLPGTTES